MCGAGENVYFTLSRVDSVNPCEIVQSGFPVFYSFQSNALHNDI